ncbi:hypothetical protein BCR33DRAFT_747520 [Rhizoclosmatium globosum]|uniref:Uncharacterized protein n=1 Tax=Rhizoclosmatium globosum TaxID=329046 RepID=A0A1Y2ASC5_9FUNG|nr:hypothetical protein BCR33DRAFT_747520 [Rhizoclosmatium globosum]|eukprot:ORY25200.1 hypothetical protein BCR33DRAFT_747520 [Rhizoclosmatium globosum]
MISNKNINLVLGTSMEDKNNSKELAKTFVHSIDIAQTSSVNVLIGMGLMANANSHSRKPRRLWSMLVESLERRHERGGDSGIRNKQPLDIDLLEANYLEDILFGLHMNPTTQTTSITYKYQRY